MAVEAHRLGLFPTQLGYNLEAMNNNFNNFDSLCNFQAGNGVASSTAETSLFPPYGSANNVAADSFVKPMIKSVDNSSFAYDRENLIAGCDIPLPSKKRSRESMYGSNVVSFPVHQSQRSSAPLSFLGHDFSQQIQQQQLAIDRSIAFHMWRVKMEIEEKRKRQARTLMAAIEEGLAKRLRAKEEEGEEICKLNLALEERVQSLAVENQIWRELAQNNEATVQALRADLEQVLVQVKHVRTPGANLDDPADDALSCCGSNGTLRTLAGEAQDNGTSRECGGGTSTSCRRCGVEESCVLLLPCRHLCLCAFCGPAVYTCPVCGSLKNASVHVNMLS